MTIKPEKRSSQSVVEMEAGGGAASGSGSGGRFKLGWKCQLAFYVPVAGLVLANVGFYWSSQRRMTKQLIYNRSMQHFQVK